MEAFKKEHPDANITATFFINGGYFSQPEYNEKILRWLIDNGYDVGNHTLNHADLTTTTYEETEEQVGYMYELLEDVIPGEYVNIVALPYGSPYDYNADNMKAVYTATYNGKTYTTKAAMQVAWKPNESPFSTDYQSDFIKRCRAYDNNGENFDITYNFNILETNRYISDGDPDTIVIPETEKDYIGQTYDKEVKTY